MSIKRYTATKDNTLTNAYTTNLTTRGTGSNMGRADSLEVFSIFGQASSSSLEATRILVQFPVVTADATKTIQADRTSGKIPASGSVNFFLRMFNVAHDSTVPRNFTLSISPVSQSWEEGYGLDMEGYKDKTYGGSGSNWINAGSGTAWTNEGGDYLTASAYSSYNYSQAFDSGSEDIEVDITGLVEQWITGTAGSGYGNYGVGIFLTSSQENANRSYYTKKFSARSSEFFFKRPIIEARWDSSKKDNRGNFYISSSTLSSADNLNILYFYNYVRGQPKNLPNVGTGAVYVTTHTSASAGTQLTTTPTQPVTGGWVSTGVYSASFALYTTESVVYDRWYSGSIYYHTGSFKPSAFESSNIYETKEYVTSVSNLRSEYYNDDIARLRVHTRLKDWNPTIYTVATAGIQNYIIEDVYFKVFRIIDDYDVISYGTGSVNHTRLSYDTSGSYFDLDMSILEVGYEYGLKFAFYINGAYDEHNHTYKFKVTE
jgi:hypothetical protein